MVRAAGRAQGQAAMTLNGMPVLERVKLSGDRGCCGRIAMAVMTGRSSWAGVTARTAGSAAPPFLAPTIYFIERAVRENHLPDQNVYIGQALRKR
jgi:hypothetical protein